MLTEAPPVDATSDYDATPLRFEEISDEAPLVIRARVVAVEDSLTFVPDGVPAEFLDATGASTGADLAYSATPVRFEVTSTIQGGLAEGQHVRALFDGCWSESSTSLTTVGADVLILGFEPPAAGVNQIAEVDARIYDWFAIGNDGRLQAGDSSLQVLSRFRVLDNRDVGDVVTQLAEPRPVD